MRRLWTFAAAEIGAGLALAPFERGRAAGAGPFDGTWSVEVNLPSAGNVDTASARFDGRSGSGRRNEPRACALTFTRA